MNRKFILKSVTLFNFYNYLGEHRIEFNTDTRNNIYLFSMENGSGKTSLFHAIKWGFYGQDFDYRKTGEKMTYKDFMNFYAHKDEGFYVSIHFEYDGKEIISTRRCKNPNVSKDILTLNIDGQMYEEPHSKRLLNQFVPPNYGSFFMFDGEELEELARAQNDAKQVEGVLQLLGLNDLKILDKRLKLISNTYVAQTKKALDDEETDRDRSSKIENHNFEIVSIGEKIKEKRDDIRENNQLKFEYETELDSLDDPGFENIQARIDKLNKEKKQWGYQEDDNFDKLANLRGYLFVEFLRDDLELMVETLSERREELTGVTDVPKRYLSIVDVKNHVRDELLDTCPVCDSKIEEMLFESDSDLEFKMSVYDRNRVELDSITNLSNIVSRALNKSDTDIQNYIDEFHSSREQSLSIQKQIDDISKQLVQTDVAHVKEIALHLTSIEKSLTNLDRDIQELEGDKAKHIRARDVLLKKGVKESKEDSLSRKYNRLSDKTNMLSEGLKRAITTGIRNKRDEILEMANEFFLEMTNKADIYQRLEYKSDTTYSMNIIKKDGNISPNPSAGELQVVAMSFLIALTKCSGRFIPILMDTPLSKLDPRHSSNIGRALAQLDNQIIFLAQPMELSEDVMESIEESLAQRFISKLSSDNNVTIVEEGL